MKCLLASILLILVAASGFGQAGQYATVGQIYNFAVGDTFEYYSGNYVLGIVTGRINYGNDSIVYSSNMFRQGTPGMQQSTQIVTDLDSVFSYPWLLQYCYTAYPFPCTLEDDTILIQNTDTLYQVTDNKLVVYPSCDDDGGSDTSSENDLVQYGKGLGVILLRQIILGSSCGDGGGEQLIYAHKANGIIWGTPFYFPVGIHDLQSTNLSAGIFPNPISDEFNLQLNQQPLSALAFKMFDATGRLVFSKIISSISTAINRGNLANGVYLYTLQSSGQILKRGKLILN